MLPVRFALEDFIRLSALAVYMGVLRYVLVLKSDDCERTIIHGHA